MPITVSADHIAAAGGGFEPQRQNNFSIIFSPPGPTDEVIRLSLKDFEIPGEESAQIDIEFGNEIRKVAGKTTYADKTLTVRDYVDQQTMELMYAWRDKVHNKVTGGIGLASEYKCEAVVVLASADGTTVERKWKMQGVWPKSIDPGKGDMTADAQNEIKMVLAVDKVFYPGE